MFIFTRSIVIIIVVIIIIFIISGSQPGSSFWQSDTPATIRSSRPQVMITSKVQLTM
jgi:uncharacterized protein YpmB